jgi:hypothetical protein
MSMRAQLITSIAELPTPHDGRWEMGQYSVTDRRVGLDPKALKDN